MSKGNDLRNNATRVPLLVAGGLVVATIAAAIHLKARVFEPVSISARVSQGSVLMGHDGKVPMELMLKGRERLAFGERIATDFLVVLDRSGSMEGDKLAHGRSAIGELLGRLGPEDRFGLVTYSDDATLLYPLELATPNAKERWMRGTSQLTAQGNTNLSRGLDVAWEITSHTSGRVVRVLLISDGLANAGDATADGLVRRAARFATRAQVLTTIGVGLDFNEYLMSALADAGTGNYHYLESSTELAEVFRQELATGQATVASGLTITLTPGEGVEVVDAAGYPLSRDGATVSFQPGSLFAGQERKIWITYRVPNQSPSQYTLGNVTLTYTADGRREVVDLPDVATVACVEDRDRFFASVDKNAYEDSVVHEAYGRLKQSVARAVREGKLEKAKEEIGRYRQSQQWMNEALRLPELDENLRDLDRLEGEVASAFEGEDQARKQNAFSKRTQADASEMRRAGAKK
ncbi:MAG TPA: VWA domain-containing protein [Vicinamibacteria bacterium]|nr:VWA domain-containing protein [Vicinamibacteria bacterium]